MKIEEALEHIYFSAANSYRGKGIFYSFQHDLQQPNIWIHWVFVLQERSWSAQGQTT